MKIRYLYAQKLGVYKMKEKNLHIMSKHKRIFKQ